MNSISGSNIKISCQKTQFHINFKGIPYGFLPQYTYILLTVVAVLVNGNKFRKDIWIRYEVYIKTTIKLFKFDQLNPSNLNFKF